MKKEFVPYEIALELKDLGFDEPCFGYYAGRSKHRGKIWYEMPNRGQESIPVGDVLAPIFTQAFRFIREKYNLRGFIGFRPNVKKFDYHVYDMSLSGKEYHKQRSMEEFNKDPLVGNYDEAELGCLKKLIEIIKKSKL
jgi:hypothetical protein